jgi:hypothetical protein
VSSTGNIYKYRRTTSSRDSRNFNLPLVRNEGALQPQDEEVKEGKEEDKGDKGKLAPPQPAGTCGGTTRVGSTFSN